MLFMNHSEHFTSASATLLVNPNPHRPIAQEYSVIIYARAEPDCSESTTLGHHSGAKAPEICASPSFHCEPRNVAASIMATENGAPKSKKRRLTKNERRRLKKKQAKASSKSTSAAASKPEAPAASKAAPDVEVIYVAPNLLEESAPEAEQLREVFENFAKREQALSAAPEQQQSPAEGEEKPPETVDALLRQAEANVKAEIAAEEAEGEEEQEGKEKEKKLSRKEQKVAKRFLVARLKQTVDRPDVVEVHDVTSSDPHLLIYLKSYRNTAAVPIHWCAKRKYLMGKRGYEKPPWKLPEFIAQTGIAKIRSAVEEKESSVKQR